MDIRNFFGKKGGNANSAAKKPSAETSSASLSNRSSRREQSHAEDQTTSGGRKGRVNSQMESSCLESDQRESSSSAAVSASLADDATKNRNRSALKSRQEERKAMDETSTFASIKKNTNGSTKDKDEDEMAGTKGVHGENEEDKSPTPPARTKRNAGNNSSVKKRRILQSDSDDDTDDGYEDLEKPTKSQKIAAKNFSQEYGEEEEEEVPSPARKKSPRSRKEKEKQVKGPPPRPMMGVKSYPNPSPGTFDGFTFVFTGNMHDLPRDEAVDYVKSYGGRVTTSVSGRTNYLVIGEVLEDGRAVEEGKKYKKAIELGENKVVILKGQEELYGLAKMLDHQKDTMMEPNIHGNINPRQNNDPLNEPIVNPYKKNTTVQVSNPYTHASSSKTAVVTNPYAKSSAVISNPYAKKSAATPINPYSHSSSMSSPTQSNHGVKGESIGGGKGVESNDSNALWADKYAPSNTHMILGNKDIVKKLKDWLDCWENTFNRSTTAGKKGNASTAKGGLFRAALLSGPPGIGKTTTAQLVAKEAGRQVLEMNASDARSKKILESSLGDVTGSHVLSFDNPKSKKGGIKKRCIIMDEVDGMGAGDRSGMSELIKMIKTSKVPIICICNDRQSQKIRSLASYCLDLKYRRPVKSVIARRAVEVGKAEGMNIEYNAAEAVAESCGNDIRQVLNCLQMWANKRHVSSKKNADMTYKDFKERDSLIKKDEMLRVTLFDAAKIICEGRKGISDADEKVQVDSFYRRTDAYFTDYALMGLLVHQNYLKVAVRPFALAKAKGDVQVEYELLVDMYNGTEAVSDFAVAEHGVRSGDQNWSLLPLCSTLLVKSGYHVGGEGGGLLPGFPEFSTWLGRNSTRGKMDRLIQELAHHMNYKISADKSELRMGYLPIIREIIAGLLMDNSKDGPRVKEAIEFMDEYGLDRDDVFENMDEFLLDGNMKKLADLDSKTKAAFTKEYNKGVHKSQALIEEQGAPTRRKRKAIDEIEEDDMGDAESIDESDTEELTAEEIKKMFSSKRKSTKGNNSTTVKKSKK